MAVIAKFNTIWLICILPILLLACVLVRINFQSLVYLLMLLVLPLLYPINQNTLNGKF